MIRVPAVVESNLRNVVVRRCTSGFTRAVCGIAGIGFESEALITLSEVANAFRNRPAATLRAISMPVVPTNCHLRNVGSSSRLRR
jgi:hypothetical protein